MVTAKEKRLAPLRTPTSLSEEATQSISAALTGLLADTFALYIKTKNFHWHVSGPHFRDYHLMLDDQAAQILGVTDAIEYGAVMPSLSKYLEQVLGHTDTVMYGLILALFSATSMVC